MFVDSQIVWIRESTECYIQGKISEIGQDKFEVIPIDKKYPNRTCLAGEIFPSCVGPQDHDDSCELLFFNEATFLENLKNRYFKDKVYNYVANILIALNPYKEMKDLYSDAAIKRYKGKSLGELPPHVFAIADKAIRDMRVLKISQSIIVSGESGSGKTESSKYILTYLCRSQVTAGAIEQKILDVSPILEAFGNAKTTRNNNSSRFGKFIQIHYDSECQVVGGYISHYLLEKSRICTQSQEERNYHVFYMICAGAPQDLKEKLSLGRPEDYRYLAGCTQYFATVSTDRKISESSKSKAHMTNGPIKDPVLDDYDNFQQLDEALSRLGMSQATKFDIYALIAGVLHLGNISFEENPEDAGGGCQVSKSSEHSILITSKLLGVDSFELRQALVSRAMQSKRGDNKAAVIMVPLKIYEASNARDALGKALYSHLFDRIVANINRSIPFSSSTYYIGVLDIAGFESFTVNSFEQFCINYCNEKLQKFFNDNILKHEQELYRREGLKVPDIHFTDNQDIIELIESKSNGIFALLDEESKLPKPSFDHFTLEVHKAWNGHIRLMLPRASRFKGHRTLRDEEGFLIRHFAGDVSYNTSQFIDKNNDPLHGSLEVLLQESANPFVKQLFTAKNDSASLRGKLNLISIGSKLKSEMSELMEKLEQNATNYIHCIKPNSRMTSCEFEGISVLKQLNSSGTTSALKVMEHGYPSRVPFDELYNMYWNFLPPELEKLDPKVFCEAMLHSLKLNRKDFKFGTTKVFFRPGKFIEFDRIMKSDSENLKTIVANVKICLVRSRWTKAIFGVISVIKLRDRIKYRNKYAMYIQKIVRGFLARKQHQPRYRGIIKMESLKDKLRSTDIVDQVKGIEDGISKQANDVENLINEYVKNIKKNVRIKPKIIDEMYDEIITKINGYSNLLQSDIICGVNESELHIKSTTVKVITEKMQRTNVNESVQRHLKPKSKKAVKRLREKPPKFAARFDQISHLPALDSKGVRYLQTIYGAAIWIYQTLVRGT
ncbi:myosin heavy chain 95F-like [Sitodiplosis mosellana]|uniref:myosin heavy chain 95F-like n=1 Tax=Sitodiplosis mosellana TaxID=263140 RepID=UPI002443CD49|nr:myosin heavy chain 95F-like [Sitodiplosis mosellana]